MKPKTRKQKTVKEQKPLKFDFYIEQFDMNLDRDRMVNIKGMKFDFTYKPLTDKNQTLFIDFFSQLMRSINDTNNRRDNYGSILKPEFPTTE